MKLFVALVFFLMAVEGKGLEKVMSDNVFFDVTDILDGGKHTESRSKKRSVIALDPKEVSEYLNEIRRKVKSKDMRELNWNYTLAKSAKSLVTTCEFRPMDRPTRPQYGRAIHSSFGKTKAKDYKEVVDAWYEEAKNFDPSSPKCTGLCTDYLTLTRNDFDRVGCAANECSDLRNGSTSETDALFVACYFFSTLNDSLLQPDAKEECAECGAKFKLCKEGRCAKDHPKRPFPGKMKRSDDETTTMSTDGQKGRVVSPGGSDEDTKVDSPGGPNEDTKPVDSPGGPNEDTKPLNSTVSPNEDTKPVESPRGPIEVTKPLDSPGGSNEKLEEIPKPSNTKKIPPKPPGEILHEISEKIPLMPTTTKGPEEVPEREPPEEKVTFAPIAPVKSGVQLGIQKTWNKLLILNILLVVVRAKSF